MLSAGAVEGLLAAVVPEFMRQSGIRVSTSFATVGLVQKRLQAGEEADVIIMSGAAIDALEREGGALPGSRRDVCRTAVGVAVREGTRLPDISTPEAFKRTLIAARSVAYTDPREGGTSSIYMLGLLDRFGITDVVAKKAVLANGGREAVEKVASGEAEIAVTLISEIVPVNGARLAGPVPQALQLYTVYAAAIPASSTDPAVGASTCASGSQVWKGNNGTLMANARKNARNSQNSVGRSRTKRPPASAAWIWA